jgi:hypothetical protein
MRASSLRIIVTGLIAQHPLLGGVAWDYLQYPLGLARLGHDVYYFEDSGEWPYNLDGGPSGNDWVAHDCSANVRHLQTVMSRSGLEDKWAYRFPIDGQWFGLSDLKRAEIIRSADLLINVSGTLEYPELYGEAGTLVYIDSDPVFTQIKLTNGNDDFCKRVNSHDIFFTFGECLSQDSPALHYNWQPTRQPVVLSEWDSYRTQREIFTTVMSWTSYPPLEYGGQKYGQKDIEFRRFLDLPTKVRPATMEVALGKLFHDSWHTDDEEFCRAMDSATLSSSDRTVRALLTQIGWKVVDAMESCGDIDRYREYIQSSKAEWSVAKNGYVQGRPGWFSCRSACYLAAGKPVIVQDTGFSNVLPTGKGILHFRTPDEAAAGIREVEGNYNHHAKAAREIAKAYFDSDKVLNRLLEIATNTKGVGAPKAI